MIASIRDETGFIFITHSPASMAEWSSALIKKYLSHNIDMGLNHIAAIFFSLNHAMFICLHCLFLVQNHPGYINI